MMGMSRCHYSIELKKEMFSDEGTVIKVVVIGASGFGRETLDVLDALSETTSSFEVLGVVDDFPSPTNLKRLKARHISYLGNVDDFIANVDLSVRFILGIGNPRIREKLVNKIQKAGYLPFSAVHPTAVLGSEVVFSPGAVISAGAVIATNVNLGKHVHVNAHATIGHDSVLEDFVSINPAAVISGEVLIKRNALIGASATVLQGRVVGENAIVGACACVTKDVKAASIVKGIPAK